MVPYNECIDCSVRISSSQYFIPEMMMIKSKYYSTNYRIGDLRLGLPSYKQLETQQITTIYKNSTHKKQHIQKSQHKIQFNNSVTFQDVDSLVLKKSCKNRRLLL